MLFKRTMKIFYSQVAFHPEFPEKIIGKGIFRRDIEGVYGVIVEEFRESNKYKLRRELPKTSGQKKNSWTILQKKKTKVFHENNIISEAEFILDEYLEESLKLPNIFCARITGIHDAAITCVLKKVLLVFNEFIHRRDQKLFVKFT